MAKKNRAQARKRKAPKDLAPKDARHVKGGGGEVVAQKSGKTQHEYMIVKMNDIIVTSVNPGGS